MAYVGFILLCLAAGGLGGVATSSGLASWYTNLEKPAWNPPNWIFGPVWTFLYITMGIAAAIVWNAAGPQRALPIGLFLLQLALNVAWSFLFFGMQNPLAGLVGIIALDLAVAATIAVFWRWSPLAAGLMLPYMAWILFATALNFALWRLNP